MVSISLNDDYLFTAQDCSIKEEVKERKSLFLHLNNKLLIGLALSIIVPKDKKEYDNFTKDFRSEENLRSKFSSMSMNE